jgi:hypothetical protein
MTARPTSSWRQVPRLDVKQGTDGLCARQAEAGRGAALHPRLDPGIPAAGRWIRFADAVPDDAAGKRHPADADVPLNGRLIRGYFAEAGLGSQLRPVLLPAALVVVVVLVDHSCARNLCQKAAPLLPAVQGSSFAAAEMCLLRGPSFPHGRPDSVNSLSRRNVRSPESRRRYREVRRSLPGN